MNRGMNNIEFAMMKDKRDGKPLLMMTNSKTPEGGYAVFAATSDDDGNIKRLDLTSADFYPLEPMSKENVIKRTYETVLEEYKRRKLRFVTKDGREIDFRAVILKDDDTAWGLAFLDDIPDDFCAVYDYSEDGPMNVGMYTPDTRISVDFVFVDEQNKIVKIHKKAKPLSRDLIECEDVTCVIELKGGQCEKNNIQVGDTIQVKSTFADAAFHVPEMYMEHSKIDCMFEFDGYDLSDVETEIIEKGKCVLVQDNYIGETRKFYIYNPDKGPTGFVLCTREDEENSPVVESLYPIFEGKENQVEINRIAKIDNTASHMRIYCDDKEDDSRVVHNPLAFNKQAKEDEICKIKLAGYVGNVYEISKEPIVPSGSLSDKDGGMTVYKCLFIDYCTNNKKSKDNPEDNAVLKKYVKNAKIFYNTRNSDTYKFMSDILDVEEFTYMGEPLYRLTVKVRKALHSKDMMEIFLYVNKSCLKGHTPKVGEYIYGNCGLIGYVGNWIE